MQCEHTVEAFYLFSVIEISSLDRTNSLLSCFSSGAGFVALVTRVFAQTPILVFFGNQPKPGSKEGRSWSKGKVKGEGKG